ncbi:MAG TPA: TetR/AcrR family transcriptional regulator [Hyphomicrobiaceae bacterium]|nr:TetR/AcrR family transcriptional regulator [Hyphomicrobiaceae bacterium]
MLDQLTAKGRIIAAALRLAATRRWGEVTLRDIAEEAGSNLVELKQIFSSKSAILAAFVRAVDDEVLRRVPRRAPDQAARDAIFEVVMSRFDVLAPYKAALASIVRDAGPDYDLVCASLASQHWMLQAAGIDTEGARGAVRVAGLASVYASVFHTWLDDDDPGLARTMAALDRRLRRGERNLETLEGVCGAFCRLGEIFTGWSRSRPRPTPPPPPSPAAPEADAQPGHA